MIVLGAAVSAVLAGSSWAQSSRPADPGPGADQAPDSYIVVYRDDVAVGAKTDQLEGNVGFASRFRYEHALKGFAARLNAQQLARIEADPDVAFVSPDATVEAVDTLASGESAPTGTRRIGAATTTTAQGAAGVNVAVIDTGIDLNYTSELNAVSGKNCVNSSNPAQDDNGHGTHVSGTIAAKNTGTGVVGVAPGTRLYAVKVLNSAGSGTWSQVICGIDWVTQNAAALNIKVASMSLGGSGSNDNNCGNTNADALHQAICRSVAAGVTYVVAAGNNGADFSTFVPAAYPEAVTVTAMSDSDGRPGALGGAPTCRSGEQDDRYASFSNYAGAADTVARNHTVAGPGVCIDSTWLGGGRNTISGTSMATPHVSGAVALCISRGACTAGGSPSSTISAIDTTDSSEGYAGDPNNSPVSGRYYGYVVWLGSSSPSATVPGAPTLSSATAGDGQVTLQWTAPSSTGGSAITGYKIYRGTASGGENLASPVATLSGSTLSYTNGGLTNGVTYWYEVSAVNGVGEGSLSNEKSATPQGSSVTVPTAPRNLTAAAAKGRGVQLSWLAPTSDGGSPITGYKVFRGTSSNGEAYLTTVSGLGFKDNSTARGATYYYYVKAVNAAGDSPASNEQTTRAS